MKLRFGSRRGERMHAVAVACLLLLSIPVADAAITTTGSVNSGGQAIGPGDTNIGQQQVYFDGTLTVDAGSKFTLGGMTYAAGSTNFASGLIDGPGTVVDLIGSGNRLEIGNSGTGSLTVSGGAVVNGRALSGAAANCGACFNFVSNGAGSTGKLTITGNGSFVDLWLLTVGQAAVFRPPTDSFTFGEPGGVSKGELEVLSGASLRTISATLGSAPTGPAYTGTERSHGTALIDGTGSTWRITTNLVNGSDPSLTMAAQANATARLDVVNGGSLLFDGVPSRFSFLHIGARGKADALVSGTGSNVTFAAGASGLVQIGRNAGAVGTLTVSAGGLVTGGYYTSIGRDGGVGTLTVDGADTLYRLNGSTDGVPGAGGTAPTVAVLDVARGGGTGTLNVRNGGKVQLEATTARPNSPGINVGRDAGSTGTVNISGAGSTIEVTAASTLPGGGAAEARNPYIVVGRQGTGTLNITAGGKLLITGNAVSTVADPRSTSLHIGGGGESSPGGVGVAQVSGVGSEIVLTGSDRFIGVGIGAGSSGQFKVSDQAKVTSTIINVGRSGGVGTMQVDNARIELSGQQTGNNLSGAGISVGSGGGSGMLHLANGAVIRVENPSGTVGTGGNIGGTAGFAGGSGIMTMNSGSRVEIVGPANLSGFNVGRSGVGILQMSDSSFDVGSTGVFQIGRDAGGIGSVSMNGSSTVAAGFVGVGRVRNADGTNANGGVATLIVNAGSAINATEVVIGSKGFLGGTGTINGSVTNYGVISPGNSPGTLVINGDFSDAGGKLILEIESDGLGGFNTDKIIFGQNSLVDMNGLNIEFQFLGTTDPAAFLATGNFDVDHFVVRDNGAGGEVALPDAAYAGATFTAFAGSSPIPGLAITPGGTVTAVPEPQTYALFGLGLAVLAWARRRAAGVSDRGLSGRTV